MTRWHEPHLGDVIDLEGRERPDSLIAMPHLARMAMSIEKFKRARSSKRGRGKFPAEARTWATRYAETRIKRGRPVAAVAANLGISDMTLRAWLHAATQASTAKLCEVIVAEPEPPPAPPPAVSLTTAQGHVVTGLDVESAAALLRAIG